MCYDFCMNELDMQHRLGLVCAGFDIGQLTGYASVYPISRQELVDGFVFRANAIAKSKWIEDFYYNNNDSRSNKFIAKDMERMRLFMPVFSGGDTGDFFDLFL